MAIGPAMLTGGSTSTDTEDDESTTINTDTQTFSTTTFGTATSTEDTDSNLIDSGSSDPDINVSEPTSGDSGSSPAGGAGEQKTKTRIEKKDTSKIGVSGGSQNLIDGGKGTTVNTDTQTLSTTTLGTATGPNDEDSTLVDTGPNDANITVHDPTPNDDSASSPAGGAGETQASKRFNSKDASKIGVSGGSQNMIDDHNGGLFWWIVAGFVALASGAIAIGGN